MRAARAPSEQQHGTAQPSDAERCATTRALRDVYLLRGDEAKAATLGEKLVAETPAGLKLPPPPYGRA